MQLNSNTIRLGLGLIVAFYVVVGGLFMQAYIPAARFNAAVEASTKPGYQYDYSSAAQQDALNADAKVRRYGALLLWGTVGLALFGGVVMVTRRKAAGDASESRVAHPSAGI